MKLERRERFGSWVVAATLLSGPALAAEDVSAVGLAPYIVNGVETQDFPTTAAMLVGSSADTASLICSATLIGCQTVLTAAHCVQDFPASETFVYLQHSGIHPVSQITAHPDYSFPVGDVAVLKLAAPVEGIAPTPINDVQPVAVGTQGVIAGFGRTGGFFGSDYGLKRYGSVVTDSCVIGISNDTSVCWSFLSPLGEPGEDSNTCNGDSGGPLFVDFPEGRVLAGVTSGGTSLTCNPTDNSVDANVFYYADWIKSAGGSDVGETSCGDLPVVGDDGVVVTAVSGSLSASLTSAQHTVSVGEGAQVLRVTMNAIDDGLSDYNLYVRAGAPPTWQDADCAATGAGQYGACELFNPAPGDWYVLIVRDSGSGDYQLTATEFGSALMDAALDLSVSSGVRTLSRGAILPFTVDVTNVTEQSLSVTVTVYVETPTGNRRTVAGPATLSLASAQLFSKNINLLVPIAAATGSYVLGAEAKDSDGSLLAEDGIGFSVR